MLSNCGAGEDSWESLGDYKEIKPVNPKGNQPWIFIGRSGAEAEAPVLWPPDVKSGLIRKDSDAGKDWGQEDNGATEDEMVGWHHWLSGHEFEQTPGDSEGQEAWHAAVHRVTKSWTPLSNWTQLGDRYCCKVSFSKHNILARLAWFFRYLSCQDLERDGLHAVLTWCFVVVF